MLKTKPVTIPFIVNSNKSFVFYKNSFSIVETKKKSNFPFKFRKNNQVFIEIVQIFRKMFTFAYESKPEMGLLSFENVLNYENCSSK